MAQDLTFGIHAITSLLTNSPEKVRQLWLQQGRQDQKLKNIIQLANKAQVNIQQVPTKTLDKMVSSRHQGVVAETIAYKNKQVSENDLPDLLDQAQKPPLILVLDGIEDPHNLGACLRSADAAGVDFVIAPKDKAASLTAAVSKVACGAAETVPFIQVTNLARTLKWLQEQGVWLYGMDGEAEQSIHQHDLTGPVAIVMGSEGKGMRRLTRESCDYTLKIPMQGTVESLNVSVATGICLFEVLRQRC